MDIDQLKEALAQVDSVARYYFFPQIPSTSDWARELVSRANGSPALDGTLVIADHQTRGRGRLDRNWVSAPGTALLFTHIQTVSATPPAALQGWQYALAPGLAVCAAIRELAPGLDVGLKYPNDVLINQRKAAGILIERMVCNGQSFVLTGIGVNVSQKPDQLPDQARWPATSLLIESQQPVSRPALLQVILRAYQQMLALPANEMLTLANKECCLLGRWISIETTIGTFEGIADRIDENGGLVLHHPDLPVHHVHTGEIISVWLKPDKEPA